MAKIGRFKNEQARETYLQMYEALEALWPLPAQQFDIPTSLGTTHVRHSGDGAKTPIVLLHPINASGLYWYRFVADLARERAVYAVDTVGTAGRSVQTAPLNRESDFATWLNEVLHGLNLERVHLVGYSHGAWHAAAVALHDPARLASVTLIEPGGVFTKPSLGVLLKLIMFGMKGTSEKNLRKINAWLTPGVSFSDQELAYAKVAMAYRMRIGWARLLKDAELQSITVPTLAIFGGETLVADPELAAHRIADNMVHGETEIYAGAGHGVLDQLPEQVIPRILDFVQQHDRLVTPTV